MIAGRKKLSGIDEKTKWEWLGFDAYCWGKWKRLRDLCFSTWRLGDVGDEGDSEDTYHLYLVFREGVVIANEWGPDEVPVPFSKANNLVCGDMV